ncbi:prostatic acid phosphatase-like [Aricia agestis]|uniref:prostatic acid phosphatase-like n=1 Tax=Aricia agestis TaxID=91739 RepID=UPI001C20B2DF|nr:prostatic acid phosphatase-like [Aricia agestis]
MKMLFIVALILVVLARGYGNTEIKFVAVIFRNGDHMPVDCFPSDRYRNKSVWPAPPGYLTNTGNKQHYMLGKYLRLQYSDLLSKIYDPEEVLVQSTDVDRTLMSAEANLAGLFRPTGKQVWDMQMPWQPIPVHTRPEHLDEVLAMKRPCPQYDLEMDKYLASPPYLNMLKRHEKLMDYLSTHVGKKVKDFTDIRHIYSCLNIEKLYNFELPAWTDIVFPEPLHQAAGLGLSVSAATPRLARLIAGPLVQRVVGTMADVMTGGRRRLVMYSGHDFTVATLLTALGVFDDVCPEYTATVHLELTKRINETTDTAEWYVRLLYRNSVDPLSDPVVLNVPYCGDLCPFHEFVKLYDHLITVDWERECAIGYDLSSLTTYCSLITVLLFIAGVLPLWATWRNTIRIDYERGVPALIPDPDLGGSYSVEELLNTPCMAVHYKISFSFRRRLERTN